MFVSSADEYIDIGFQKIGGDGFIAAPASLMSNERSGCRMGDGRSGNKSGSQFFIYGRLKDGLQGFPLGIYGNGAIVSAYAS